MRVVLALLVVVALTVIGVQAATRVLEREQPPDAQASATSVADAWADAVAVGDLERLAALAAERADDQELRDAHTEVLPLLGEVDVAVARVAEDGNEAVAELATTASPVDGASWQWTSTLELIRDRGVWSVDWEPAALHPELAPGWRLQVHTVAGSRAPVLDRDGRALSRTGDVVEVGVEPGRLPERSRVLVTVAEALPAAFEPLEELLDRGDLRDDWYYPLTTVPAEVADAAWPDLLSLPGLIRRDAEAGTGAATVASDVVGTIEVDDGGDRVGTSGLERVYDDRLRGSATTEVRLLDPDGDRRGLLYEFQQDVSPPLVTTLDLDVQRAVEEVVDGVEQALGVVVVDAASGGVLAIASRPATGFVRALEGLYPPAAVAGIVPVTAALLDGAGTGDRLECPSSGTAGGVTVTTREPQGGVRRLAGALTGACDVGVARLGASLGDEAMADAVALLGLDEAPSLPIDAVGWSWPPAANDAAAASAAIGHGQVQASALGAASLAAAVARGAPAPPALLVEDVVSVEPWPGGVTTGLRQVMRTAGRGGPVSAPGVRVAGLTAASGQVRGDPTPTTGWWVGFLEGDAPDVALAVVVEDDEDGRRAAGIADAVVESLAG